MNKFKDVIQKLKELRKGNTLDYKLCYRFPDSYIVVTNTDFKSDEEDENELKLCNLLGIELDILRKLANQSMVLFECLSKEEFDNYDEVDRGTHWSELLIEEELDLKPKEIKADDIKVVHFYGYKGGQGRSSVLAQLASSLMNDGWKVLVIDSDLEAPSLDIIFDKQLKLEDSLLGIYLKEDVKPFFCDEVYGKGSLHMIGAKPDQNDWDIEYASLTLQASVNPSIIEYLANYIKKINEKEKFDIILIDHRSGLSLSPVVWQKYLNGPFMIFSKMDNQWKHFKTFFKRLIRSSHIEPYAGIISLMPYLESKTSRENEDIESQKQKYKDILLDALKEKPEFIDSGDGDMDKYIYRWPYQTQYSENLLPDIKTLSKDSQDCIRGLRTSLNIHHTKVVEYKRSSSGILDMRSLIVTRELANLINPESPVNYIFGRKGTGKTRIFSELIKSKKVKPLLASNDFFSEQVKRKETSLEGVNTKIIDSLLQTLNENKKIFPKPTDEDPEPEPTAKILTNFWWCILYFALETMRDKNGFLKSDVIVEKLAKNLNYENLKKEQYKERILEFFKANKSTTKIIFAIDGLEETFHTRYIKGYVNTLQEVMEHVATIPELYRFLGIKLFLRSDLIMRSYQNFDQLGNRKVELKWNKQSIFNFLVSSILFRRNLNDSGHEKFNQFLKQNLEMHYKKETLDQYEEKVKTAELSVSDCIEFLEKIFDSKLGAGNAYLETFFTQFFTDSEKTNAQYYPRVYDFLLDTLALNFTDSDDFLKEIKVKKGKFKVIKNNPVIYAYESVAKEEYLNSLKEELEFLLDFRKEEIDTFVKSFEGKRTPFEKKEMVQHIASRLVNSHLNLNKEGKVEIRRKVDKALDSLFSIGILEEVPNNHTKLRVGRLIKAAFKMTYKD